MTSSEMLSILGTSRCPTRVSPWGLRAFGGPDWLMLSLFVPGPESLGLGCARLCPAVVGCGAGQQGQVEMLRPC